MHKIKIYDNESLLYIFLINYVLQCSIESQEKICVQKNDSPQGKSVEKIQ